MSLRAEIARAILPVPKALRVEADEYVFTLAAATGGLALLPLALTFYRQHEGSLYNAAARSVKGLRHKQMVLGVLVDSLQAELPRHGVPAAAVCCVVQIPKAEADQLRLMLDGGSPLETVRTENMIYRIMHGDAPLKHRLFRWVTMVPACVLPPRTFYAARRWLTEQSWYQVARKRTVPVPGITRVEIDR